MNGFQELAEQRKYVERTSSVASIGRLRRRRSVTLSDVGIVSTAVGSPSGEHGNPVECKQERRSSSAQWQALNMTELYQEKVRATKVAERLEQDISKWQSRYNDAQTAMVEMSQRVASQKLQIKQLETSNYLLRESILDKCSACAKHEERSAAFYCHAHTCDSHLDLAERETSVYKSLLQHWSDLFKNITHLLEQAHSHVTNPHALVLINSALTMLNNENKEIESNTDVSAITLEKQHMLSKLKDLSNSITKNNRCNNDTIKDLLSQYQGARESLVASSVENTMSGARGRVLQKLLASNIPCSATSSFVKTLLLHQKSKPGSDKESRVASIIARSAVKFLRLKFQRDSQESQAAARRSNSRYARRIRSLLLSLEIHERNAMASNDDILLHQKTAASLKQSKNHSNALRIINSLAKDQPLSSTQQLEIENTLKLSDFSNTISYIVSCIAAALCKASKSIASTLTQILDDRQCDISSSCLEVGVVVRNLVEAIGEKISCFAAAFASQEQIARDSWTRRKKEQLRDVGCQTDYTIVISESTRSEVLSCHAHCQRLIDVLKSDNHNYQQLNLVTRTLCNQTSEMLNSLHEIDVSEIDQPQDTLVYAKSLSSIIGSISGLNCGDNIQNDNCGQSEVVETAGILMSKLTDVVGKFHASESDARVQKVSFLGVGPLRNRSKSLDVFARRESGPTPASQDIASLSCTLSSSFRLFGSKKSNSLSVARDLFGSGHRSLKTKT